MTNNKNDSTLLGTLFAGTMYVLMLVAGYTLVYVFQALLFPLKRPVSRYLNLELHSASWQKMKWLYRIVQAMALVVALHALGQAVIEFRQAPLPLSIVMGVFYSGLFLAMVLVFDIVVWLKQYANDPEIQKNAAGAKAEHVVQQSIDKLRSNYPGSCALHGSLFVFNPDTPNEFSLETDHILVTRNNIFVIETKYKSGTISAKADAPFWPVSANRSESTMRNALKQAKNAVRVLTQEYRLSGPVIPVVAICGNDVKIVDGPGNVVAADGLANLISAFEHEEQGHLIDPERIIGQLKRHVSTDRRAMDRHKARAQEARQRSERQTMVQTASLD